MLILRRKPGESLLIGDDVEVEILEMGGSGVKIGIRAPKGISILRKELQLTQAENRAAARPLGAPLTVLSDFAKSIPVFSGINSQKSELPR